MIKGRGDSEWAARVVLEVGRRSSSLLPDDSGADEATLAAQGIEAAHGIGVSDLGGLTEEAVEVLVGVDVSASGHLEGKGLAFHAVPGPVVPDLSRHQRGEEGTRIHCTRIVRESCFDVRITCGLRSGTRRDDVEVLQGIALCVLDSSRGSPIGFRLLHL